MRPPRDHGPRPHPGDGDRGRTRLEAVPGRAVRFDHDDALDDTTLGALPAVASVKHDDDAVLLYTLDVAATIGGLIAAAEARGIEPKNLGVRRATLEDVFLDLTGRALRD